MVFYSVIFLFFTGLPVRYALRFTITDREESGSVERGSEGFGKTFRGGGVEVMKGREK